MKKEILKYPRYYNVNDVSVVLELVEDDVVGKSANGMPYGIGKAIVDGYLITKTKYIKMAQDLYGKNFIR